ncbi:MAG: alpha/beta hydrolase [Deltaproteobacteria bacterium]|nr:MAG: alpha/beta hydrolase [Deltaproteobacteria bacterium]
MPRRAAPSGARPSSRATATASNVCAMSNPAAASAASASMRSPWHNRAVPARLYHERIAREARAPARWLMLTHGIYGAGSNWRGIARKLNQRRPDWGVALVDLRQHGRSEPGAPPHTLAACADDLRAAAAEIGGVEAIAGHSFGGKVALAARPRIAPRQTWVLDASPSRRAADPSSVVMRVLGAMERAPRGWARRDDFIAAIIAEGHDDGLARWLAMSLVPEPSGTLALRFDFAALRAMLADYHATDLWDVLPTSTSTASRPGTGCTSTIRPRWSSCSRRICHDLAGIIHHAAGCDRRGATRVG